MSEKRSPWVLLATEEDGGLIPMWMPDDPKDGSPVTRVDVVDTRPEIDPEFREAFEANWERNKEAYRYLDRGNP